MNWTMGDCKMSWGRLGMGGCRKSDLIVEDSQVRTGLCEEEEARFCAHCTLGVSPHEEEQDVFACVF